MPVIDSIEITEEELESYAFPEVRTSVQYVDNQKLTQIMISWAAEVAHAKKNNLEHPRIPEFVGQAIMLIATNLARKGNFRDYSWVDEMIEDGIDACVRYLHNWRPDATTRGGYPNPYGYISRIVEQAFRHRIEIEKRQDYYKNKSLLLMGGPDVLEGEDWGDSAQTEAANNMLRDMVNRAYEYEEKQAERAEKDKLKQKAKNSASTLLDIFEEYEEQE